MTDKPTDEALENLFVEETGFDTDDFPAAIFDFARAVLAKWGTLRADKIVIPTDTMEQEFQQHYRRGYEAGKKASTPQPTQMQAGAVPLDEARHMFDAGWMAAKPVAREPLTDEQIQDLLLCGNPTDEEMRLIRIGWDAAHGIKGGQHVS